MTKEYVGVKKVIAWPQDGKDGQPGYAVKYEDGYISWSPKDVFEKAYRPMDDIAGMSWSFVGVTIAAITEEHVSDRPDTSA